MSLESKQLQKEYKEEQKLKLSQFRKLCMNLSDSNSFIQCQQKRNRLAPRKYTHNTRSSRVLPPVQFWSGCAATWNKNSLKKILCSSQDTWEGTVWETTPRRTPQPKPKVIAACGRSEPLLSLSVLLWVSPPVTHNLSSCSALVPLQMEFDSLGRDFYNAYQY